MSGVLLPIVHLTGAISSDVRFHIDDVKAIERLDIPAIGNTPGRFFINVSHKDGKFTKVEYVDALTRDTDYTNFDAAFTTTV